MPPRGGGQGAPRRPPGRAPLGAASPFAPPRRADRAPNPAAGGRGAVVFP